MRLTLLIMIISLSSWGANHKVFGLSSQEGIPQVKVLIKKSLKKVFISGTDLRRKFHFNNSVKNFSGRKSVKFNCHKLSGKIKSLRPQLLASLDSFTGMITLGNKNEARKYRGKLHILTAKNNKSCDVVAESSLEDYLATLLSKEMNANWPLEALKAQAVAARTYALHKIESGQVSFDAGFNTFYDLENSEKHQVSGSFFDTTRSTRKAAVETSGYVLVNNKNVMNPVFFHAKCGGKTLAPEHVWQNKVAGYKSVICPRCHEQSKDRFAKKIGYKEFLKFVHWLQDNDYMVTEKGFSVPKKPTIHLLKDNRYSRIVRFYLNDYSVVIKKSLLRRYFGRSAVPSNNFKMSYNKKLKSFSLLGKGHGHGVGLCQVGALEMARQGWGFKKILAHYFPKFKLRKVY